MSDDDAHALAAYLKSLPPIRHKMPDRIPPGQPGEGSAPDVPAAADLLTRSICRRLPWPGRRA